MPESRGIDLEAAARAARDALAAQAERIDELNVYPVPDGDTGTNMLHTLEAVLEEVSGKPYGSPEEAARAVSRSALMGARGNAGVILSQILRGACGVLGHARALDGRTVSEALEAAAERARSSVREPVEGTMLTVIRDAARAAREAAGGGRKDPAEVLRAAAREARASVRRTPQLLDVLREAGVVDAGGLGLAVILEGLSAHLAGREPEGPTDQGEAARPDLAALHAGEEPWGYCTQFVVEGFSGSEGEFEERIRSMGRNALVVSGDGAVRVHLHTQDPGEPLSYATGFGRLSDISIEDMEAQVRERAPEEPPAGLGVVAVVRGEGSRKMFERVGAVVVEADPEAGPLAEAIRRTGAEEVLVLPNGRGGEDAARRAGELAGVRVHLIPTGNIAGGLVAMTGYDPGGDPEEVAERMRRISAETRCAEVVLPDEKGRAAGREVPRGACVGLLDGEPEVVAESVEEAAVRLVRRILEEDGVEIITLLWGEGLDEEAARRISRRIEQEEGVETETLYGGQPLSPLQLAAG